MKQSHNTQMLRGSLPGGGAMSTGTVFILYFERVNIVPLQPLMHHEIFWKNPCTQLGALLLDLFSSYNAFFL